MLIGHVAVHIIRQTEGSFVFSLPVVLFFLPSPVLRAGCRYSLSTDRPDYNTHALSLSLVHTTALHTVAPHRSTCVYRETKLTEFNLIVWAVHNEAVTFTIMTACHHFPFPIIFCYFPFSSILIFLLEKIIKIRNNKKPTIWFICFINLLQSINY